MYKLGDEVLCVNTWKNQEGYEEYVKGYYYKIIDIYNNRISFKDYWFQYTLKNYPYYFYDNFISKKDEC